MGDTKKQILRSMPKNFREFIEARAELAVPFRFVVDIEVPAGTTSVLTGTVNTSTRGWFFADRVEASYYAIDPQSGVKTYRPLANSDPVVAGYAAAGTPISDVPDFVWGYAEDRTNLTRQNEALLVPGDLLFRRDGDGYNIGGDPWGTRSVITVSVAPLNAPSNDGVMTFVFNGVLYLGTGDNEHQEWLSLRQRFRDELLG